MKAGQGWEGRLSAHAPISPLLGTCPLFTPPPAARSCSAPSLEVPTATEGPGGWEASALLRAQLCLFDPPRHSHTLTSPPAPREQERPPAQPSFPQPTQTAPTTASVQPREASGSAALNHSCGAAALSPGSCMGSQRPFRGRSPRAQHRKKHREGAQSASPQSPQPPRAARSPSWPPLTVSAGLPAAPASCSSTPAPAPAGSCTSPAP